MVEPKNKKLYDKVKKEADNKFSKPSAYRSSWIVREYKKRGGEYEGKRKSTKLKKAIKEFDK